MIFELGISFVSFLFFLIGWPILRASLITRRLRAQPDEKLRRELRHIMDECPRAGAFYEKISARGQELAAQFERDPHLLGQDFPKEIDIVLPAAGFRGQYVCGMWSVLRHLQTRVRVCRISGGCSGAQCGLLMSTDALRDWVTFCFAWRAHRDSVFRLAGGQFNWIALLLLFLRGGLVDLTDAIFGIALGPSIEKYCEFRRKSPKSVIDLHITTLCVWPPSKIGLRSCADFENVDDMMECMRAASDIPGISGPFTEKCRGLLCVDPGFFQRMPVPLPDLERRPQLVCGLLNLWPGDDMKHNWTLWGPSEELQEDILRRGQDAAVALLRGAFNNDEAVRLEIP